MARLTVKLYGEEVTRITLESGNEYIAGRAQDAQIPLTVERGISRHHLKLYEKEGVWVCESLSKFGLLQKGNEALPILELHENCVFSVPPYEFYFEREPAANEAPSAPARPSENLPAFVPPRVSSDEHTYVAGGHEATIAGVAVSLIPYIRISFPNTADDEVLKLEGHLWVAGRDPGSEIPIESQHVSRKHFELVRTKEGFFITDLGSSNGTKINGQRIPPHEPKRVESGDEISIKNISMVFEIRDAGFSSRMESLPVPAIDPMLALAPAPWYPPTQNDPTQLDVPTQGTPRRLKDFRLHHLRHPEVRKKAIRYAIIALIPLLLIGLLKPSKPAEPPRDPAGGAGTSVTFDKLSVEQRSVIKDSFTLARNLYVQGKYELCLAELAKVHELVPVYENSKELQSFCEQGRELVHRQRIQEEMERKRRETEQKISGLVDTCKDKLKDHGSVDETRQCLAEAMELDPEHHLIVEMIHAAQVHEEELKYQVSVKKDLDSKVQKGIAHYKRAKDLYKSGKLAMAQAEYEKFIGTSYPRSEEMKSTAKRELASIKTELKAKVDSKIDQCKSLGEKAQFRDAYLACDKAVEEDPGNTAAKDMRKHMQAELKRELKGVYEDSVLEESLGNVDSAKEKWKKIIKDDLPNGDYATKARSKLQKYGVEL